MGVIINTDKLNKWKLAGSVSVTGSSSVSNTITIDPQILDYEEVLLIVTSGISPYNSTIAPTSNIKNLSSFVMTSKFYGGDNENITAMFIHSASTYSLKIELYRWPSTNTAYAYLYYR